MNFKQMKRLCVQGFIFLQVYIMFFWSLPNSSFRTSMVAPVRSLVMWLGLWQSWDMFAPDPSKLNFDIIGKVIYPSGEVKVWNAPKKGELSFLGDVRYSRYKKWLSNVRADTQSMLWPDTAAFVLNQVEPARPGVSRHGIQVELIRRWSMVPNPLPQDYQPLLDHYPFNDEYSFYKRVF